jgi:hypothetical protein
LTRPDAFDSVPVVRRISLAPGETAGGFAWQETDRETVAEPQPRRDLYAASVELALIYRLDPQVVYAELERLYTAGDAGPGGVPAHHLPALAAQIETQLAASHPVDTGNSHE